MITYSKFMDFIFNKMISGKRNTNTVTTDIKSLVRLDKVSNKYNDKVNIRVCPTNAIIFRPQNYIKLYKYSFIYHNII